MNSYNREILRLALPSIATNVTVPLLGLVDLAIVGHIGNETMIGAIAVGSMIFNVMYWLMGFLRMGTTGMTANTTLVGEVLSRFLRLAFLIALCFLVLQVPLRWLSLWLMGPSEGVAAYVRVYFNICIWGAPAVLGLYVMSGWFIGMKDTHTPMIVSISQNLINILLSLLFVFVFGMKIEGVALGTLIAQWSGALMAWGKANPGRPTPQPLPVREGSEMPNQVANQEESQAERVSTPLPSREGQGVGLQGGGSPSSFGGVEGGCGVGGGFSFFQVNRDIFLRTVCLVAVNLFFTSAGARQGDLLLSVNTLLLTFFTLFSYVMDGFANAGEALCGKTASQEMDKGMVIRHLFRWGWLMVVLFTAVYALGGRAFLSLLSDEGHVVDAAMAYLPWALLIPISGMAAFVYDGVFIGMLLTRGMLVSCAVATAAFFGLFFMLFPQWHNHALWLALIVYLALRGLMQWIILMDYSKETNNMKNLKRLFLLLLFGLLLTSAYAYERPFGKGTLRVTALTPHAVRIQYFESPETLSLPELVYVQQNVGTKRTIAVDVDADGKTLCVKDAAGMPVFKALHHELTPAVVAGENTQQAQLTFAAADGRGAEWQYGLGQFQDGFTNVNGLSRRLTQVNTQISVPLLISNQGYGVLWNNMGMTEFNPCELTVSLEKAAGSGKSFVVDATSTSGNRKDVREQNNFVGTVDIAEEGDYALLLDVGQSMARRHHLAVDGKTIIDMSNVWLPPTASQMVHLTAGQHVLQAELTSNDRPSVGFHRVDGLTTFRSPVAQMVDYTVFVGTPDEIIAAYRQLTGVAPLMPKWALGYIHCRERFHSQDELLQTANRFRQEQLPVDVMVQDWQYWGRHGWNSMRFDEEHYPQPRLMTDSLHRQHMRLMLSVWSKIDKNSEVGRQMERDGFYIPNTDWIDFFNPNAAAAYWRNFSQRLVPLGIDAWWQDATEPENDDLVGRRVGAGRYAGEWLRNVYPLMVNKTVCEGLLSVQPERRPMILTRSGFAGIQRYGSALWSGDVGNDFETLRRQISAGLGLQAAGVPWWTYDAGGFFRPSDQYQNPAYIQRMLRWIETSVYLPLMRVHGYMSNTEPWNYGAETQQIIAKCLNERYRLLPYIYSEAAAVTFDGSTLMRPLVFDFPRDEQALSQRYQYMFGHALLVSPVVEADVNQWTTYLPQNAGGWYDWTSGHRYEGGREVTTAVDASSIPVFVRGGSIVPYGPARQYAEEKTDEPIELRVYPGADASFMLYDDDGESNDYRKGLCSRIHLQWDDARCQLTIGKRMGTFEGMPRRLTFRVVLPDGKQQIIDYRGKRKVVKF